MPSDEVKVCQHEGPDGTTLWNFEHIGEPDGLCLIVPNQISPTDPPTITCAKDACEHECVLESRVDPDFPDCIFYSCVCRA